MRMVVALGGNAILRRGEKPEAEIQRRNVAHSTISIAELAAANELVVTHGNGPQIGFLSALAHSNAEVPPYPLDVLGAESEGMIGYMIEQELGTRLPNRQIATLLTQVEVDVDDPAFGNPTKPIGSYYDQSTAERFVRQFGWELVRDGDMYRRVVASPEPRVIVELATIKLLMAAGVIVICAGGGGIPVVRDPSGARRGIAAVIDKDLASALLAQEIGATGLLLLTDVPAVYTEWRSPSLRAIRRASAAAMRKMSFDPGSMAPKVEAACRFAEATGGWAAIGALQDAAAIAAGEAGTRIELQAGALTYWET
jgi:carbamate kinase